MEQLKELFKQSTNGFANYRAAFAKIDAVFPIEGADKLMRAVVRGRSVVVSKNLSLNDIYVYIPVESSISHKYLSKNNLYRISSESYQLNDNFDEVTALLDSGKTLGELSSMGGFFEKNGRVKQIKIRGVYSQGYLADVSSLIKAYNILSGYSIDDFKTLDGVCFDVIGDDIFCEKYMVNGKKFVEQKVNDQKHYQKRSRNLRRASILIPGQFRYHYDTVQFGDAYKNFTPDDDVTISVKIHGSSGIFANVLCYKRDEDMNFIQRMFKWVYKPREYRLLYASRTKIRNEKVYDAVREENYFYGSDIWGPVRDILEPFIRPGMIVYGEICGYVEGSTKMIQKGHDYGCVPGQWKFMPYRIDSVDKKGNHHEWNLKDVVDWTIGVGCQFIRNGQLAEANRLMICSILYEGKLKDLYPELDYKDENWNINLLENMSRDKELLGMEIQEPLCKMKAPREGVVIRINNDKTPRAWKLKSAAHYDLERRNHDAGECDLEEES